MAFKMQSYWSIGLKMRYRNLQMHWEPQGMLIPSLWETLWKAQAEIFNKEKTVPRVFKYLSWLPAEIVQFGWTASCGRDNPAMLQRHAEQTKAWWHCFQSWGLTAADSRAGTGVTFEYKEHWVFWLISAGIKRSEENIPPAASSSEAALRNNSVGLMNRLSSHSRITGEIFKSSALRQTVRLMKFLQCWKVYFWKLHSKCFRA